MSATCLGLVMLAHDNLERAAQVIRHWATHDCPIVVHIDAKTPDEDYDTLSRDVSDLGNVSFCKRYDCQWGTWSLVEATQEAATLLLDRHPDVSHVALVSGSCIPLRRISFLVDYLDRAPDVDYIESVSAKDVPWTIGGLHLERFTLHYPFHWKRHRRLFDAFVELQRRLGIERPVPDGVEPHLGSQWWCLTRRTVSAILTDPRRPELDAYFKRTWIPDESYFQSLVRRVSENVESRSLTLSKFDPQGKPFVFYDDHLPLLTRSGCFIARKIWPGANQLYKTFLDLDRHDLVQGEPQPHKIDRILSDAVVRMTTGRPGLFMQSRFPKDTWQAGKSAAPYTVLQGFHEIFEEFTPWLSQRTGAKVHGHLFSWDGVEFANGDDVAMGGLSNHVPLRDYNPEAFLANLIWNGRGQRQCFFFAPSDRQEIADYFAWDANAQIAVVSGSWAYKLFRSKLPFDEIRKQAAWMQRVEDHFLGILKNRALPSTVRIWSLAEFLDDTASHLEVVLQDMNTGPQRRLDSLPAFVDFDGFPEFLQRLKNAGMKPYLTGEVVSVPVRRIQQPGATKPYLIR